MVELCQKFGAGEYQLEHAETEPVLPDEEEDMETEPEVCIIILCDIQTFYILRVCTSCTILFEQFLMNEKILWQSYPYMIFFYTGCFPTFYFLKLMDNNEVVFSLFFEKGLRFCCPVMFWKTKFLYLCLINQLLESIIRVLVVHKTMEYKTPQQAHSYSNDIYHVY